MADAEEAPLVTAAEETPSGAEEPTDQAAEVADTPAAETPSAAGEAQEAEQAAEAAVDTPAETAEAEPAVEQAAVEAPVEERGAEPAAEEEEDTATAPPPVEAEEPVQELMKPVAAVPSVPALTSLPSARSSLQTSSRTTKLGGPKGLVSGIVSPNSKSKARAVATRASSSGGGSQRVKPPRETLIKTPKPKPHGLQIYSVPDQFKLPYQSQLSQKLYVLHPNEVKPFRLKTILPGMYAEAPALSGAEGYRARPPRKAPLWKTHPPPRVPARGEYIEIRNCREKTVSEEQLRSYNRFTTALDSRHTERWVDTIKQSHVAAANDAAAAAEEEAAEARYQAMKMQAWWDSKHIGCFEYLDPSFKWYLDKSDAWLKKQRDYIRMMEERELNPYPGVLAPGEKPPSRLSDSMSAPVIRSPRGTEKDRAVRKEREMREARQKAVSPSLLVADIPIAEERSQIDLVREGVGFQGDVDEYVPAKRDRKSMRQSVFSGDEAATGSGRLGFEKSFLALGHLLGPGQDQAPLVSKSMLPHIMSQQQLKREQEQAKEHSPRIKVPREVQKLADSITGRPKMEDFLDAEHFIDTTPGAWRNDEGHQKWIKTLSKRKNVDVKQLKLNAALNEFQGIVDIMNRRQYMANYHGQRLRKNIKAPEAEDERKRRKEERKAAEAMAAK